MPCLCSANTASLFSFTIDSSLLFSFTPVLSSSPFPREEEKRRHALARERENKQRELVLEIVFRERGRAPLRLLLLSRRRHRFFFVFAVEEENHGGSRTHRAQGGAVGTCASRMWSAAREPETVLEEEEQRLNRGHDGSSSSSLAGPETLFLLHRGAPFSPPRRSLLRRTASEIRRPLQRRLIDGLLALEREKSDTTKPKDAKPTLVARSVVPVLDGFFFLPLLLFPCLPVLPPSPTLSRLSSVPSSFRGNRMSTEATSYARGRSLEDAAASKARRRNGRATAAIVFFLLPSSSSHLSLSLSLRPPPPPPPPFHATPTKQLPAVGVDAQFVTFTNTTMESDKFICIRETGAQVRFLLLR